MSSIRIALLALVVTLSAATPVVVADEEQVIGQPSLELYSPNNQFSTGEDTTLEVFIANDGRLLRGGPEEHVDRVTTARATTIRVRSGNSPIEVETGRYAVGTVPEGTTGPIPIRITIPDGAEPGTYQLPVRVQYTYTRIVTFGGDQTKYSDNSHDRTTTLEIEITDDPRFRIVESETDALIGDRGTFSVTLENIGQEAASDASVVAVSGSDEVRFGTGSAQSEGFVGSWEPGEQQRVQYTVTLTDEARVRNYTITTTVDFEDEDGIAKQSRDLKASLRPRPEQTFQLVGVDGNLRVDEEGTITGTVVNEGPQPAGDPVLVVTENNPNLDIVEDEYALPDLPPGDGADFAFDVDVSDAASAGPRQFSFTVRYRNPDDDQRQSDALQARVGIAERRDRFRVEPVDATMAAGSSGQITLRVTNRRDDPLSDLSAKAFPNDPLSSDDDEAFVPTLEPGESTEITFGLSVGGAALAKMYPLSLDFQYELPDGETRLSKTYTVAVTVTEPEQRNLPIVPIGVAVAVLGGAVAVIWFRRRR